MSDLQLKGGFAPLGKTAAGNPLRDSFLQLQEAELLRQQRKLDRAQAICEALVRRYPDYMGALHTLGLIYADKKNYQRAFDCLARATMLNPRSWNTLTALSGVYLELGAKEMAAQALEQAKLLKPQDTNVLVTLGEIYREEREYELARDAYRQAAALEKDLVPAAMGFGECCAALGQYAEAAEVFEDLVKRGLRLLDPVFALAGLPASVVSIDLLAQLEQVVREPSEDKAEFESSQAFARAAALDKAGRHAEAWERVVPANRSLFAAMRKDLADMAERRRASLAALQANSGKAALGGGAGAGGPISLFILGASRSGKTTMEALVATLDGVKRGYENPGVENAVRRAFQTAALLTSNFLENLPPQLDSLCREFYVEELARRAGAAKVFTNTHPVRIHDAARMLAAFPNVRLILMKRDPEDNVLRIYMRKYRSGNAYAYDLKTARDNIVWHHRMIDLLAEKFPRFVRVIRYEDMVADPAAALRVAADLCGLAVPEQPVPAVGDDRGCAQPYRQFMAAEA